MAVRREAWCLLSRRQMRIPRVLVVVMVVSFAGLAQADDLSQLSGRVSDSTHDTAVEGALVYVAGSGGLAHTLTTDSAGRYSVALRAGLYNLIFVHGRSRTSGRIAIVAGRPATLDGRVDSLSGEVIVIRERLEPAVLPKVKNFSSIKAPPYSDRAVLSDAWTKAWMLLDLDEAGRVVRFKFLKRPGYDLEKIATSEVFKLAFDPARDATGKPIKSWILWSIEWPSAWWLGKFVGTRSRMPPIIGFPPRSMAAYVPCRGSGPMNLGSVHPTYKDCSKPDLSKAATELWVER